MASHFPKKTIFICTGIIAIILVIYWQVHSFDVVFSDEIGAMGIFQEGFNLQNLKTIFDGSKLIMEPTIWEPVSFFFCIIDAELFGSRPGPRHLVNVIFHITCALLLYLVLVRSTRQAWLSGFTALLFAAHPLNVEAVAWIALHDTTLSGMFMILGLWAYLKYAETPTPVRYMLILLCFILGLMSNPRIIIFPFILLLFDYWPLQSCQQEHRYRNLLPPRAVIHKLPFFILMLLWTLGSWLYYRHSNISQLEITLNLDSAVIPSLRQIPVSYLEYIQKIFCPVGLAPARLLSPQNSSPGEQLLAAISLVFLSGLAFWAARRGYRYIAMGWSWFLISMIPGVVLNAMNHKLIADRYAYIGAIGIFILISWGGAHMISFWKHKKLIAGISMTVTLVVFSCLSWSQTRHWQDITTLLNYVIRISPPTPDSYKLLGCELHHAGKRQEAMHAYLRALRLKPDSAGIYNSMGVIKEEMGKPREAIEMFEKALQLEPEYADAYHNLGNILLDEGKINAAVTCFRKALTMNPSSYQTHNSLATALVQKGQINSAIEHLQAAVDINPGYQTARTNLARIKGTRQRQGNLNP